MRFSFLMTNAIRVGALQEIMPLAALTLYRDHQRLPLATWCRQAGFFMRFFPAPASDSLRLFAPTFPATSCLQALRLAFVCRVVLCREKYGRVAREHQRALRTHCQVGSRTPTE
mmetsp:Transcript_69894/g.116079  ORF Transcript_69894/g.116079 Transcript_69894/m.116079 type:complete len:114 (-) Transcript_69894:271-612(-)